MESDLTLSAAKQQRKKAEEDAAVLANRLALLREEEAKAMRKIEETRKRAREIMEKKLRLEQERKEKEEERRQKDEEMRVKVESIKVEKEERKTAKMTARDVQLQRLKMQVQEVRENKAQCQEQIERHVQEDLLEKSRITQKVKDEAHEAKRRRSLEGYERQARFKAELLQRTQQEINRKRAIDEEISQLEAEELALINRLQNTQLLHKTALQELEDASSRPLDITILLQDLS